MPINMGVCFQPYIATFSYVILLYLQQLLLTVIFDV